MRRKEMKTGNKRQYIVLSVFLLVNTLLRTLGAYNGDKLDVITSAHVWGFLLGYMLSSLLLFVIIDKVILKWIK
jgi:hypothetical protein